MKKLLLISAISMNNLIFPCEWMLDLIETKHTEAHQVLLQFESVKKDEMDEIEQAYWYTVGRTEALLEILEDFHK
jgi:hypothetical protein